MRLRNSGWTLLELIAALAIVAVLTAIALPSYRYVMMKSRRAEGKVFLQTLMAAEERFYAATNRYANSTAALGVSAESTGKFYNAESFELSRDGQLVTIFAAPRGPQSDDSCGHLFLSSNGLRGAANAGASSCW